MNRVHVLVAAILVMVPVAGWSQGASSVPFVAVFEMRNEGAPLRSDALSRMGNYLFSNLAACGSFRLVPQDQVRSRLAQQKTESYRECYDQTCQIELSREMAADKALSSSVTKVGSVCQVSASLYDLTTAAIDRAAVAEGPCTEDGIRRAILTVVARLCGAGPGRGTPVLPDARAAPPPTWDHQGTTSVAPDLPEVADERGVLRVEGTPRSARVDVTGPRGFGTNGTLATALPYGPATVPAGEYRVQVSAPDHDADTRTVKVYADRTAVVEVALVPSNGVLELWGRPAGAKVELACQNGFSRTFGLPESATAIPVPRGSCRVQVTRNGYEPFGRQLDVAGGQTTRVDVNLVQSPEKPQAVLASAASGNGVGSHRSDTVRAPSSGVEKPGSVTSISWPEVHPPPRPHREDKALALAYEKEAYAFFRAKDYDGATGKWLDVIRTWSGAERSYGDLAYGYYLGHRYEQCLEAAKWCLDRVGTARTLGACLFSGGMCLRELGRPAEAILAFRRSLSYRENDIVRAALEALESR